MLLLPLAEGPKAILDRHLDTTLARNVSVADHMTGKLVDFSTYNDHIVTQFLREH